MLGAHDVPLLADHGEVRERRDQLRHPHYSKPELLATMPNELWSWDITKLLGPVKWTYYYLYVILDIFSRLIRSSLVKQGVEPGQLTLHADRGSSMRSKPVALLLADLAVTKTHSRPPIHMGNASKRWGSGITVDH